MPLSAKFAQVKRLLAAAEFQQAAVLCEELLVLQPGHAGACVSLGVVALQAGQPERTLEWVSRAIKAEPRNAWAHSVFGNALLDLGRAESALQSFNAAIALYPGYGAAYYNRGNALLDLGRFDDAIADFEVTIAAMPEFSPAHNNKGIALAACGQLPAAVASFDKAIEADPGNSEAHYDRGRALQALQHWDEALDSYEAALRIDPGLATAHNNRATVLERAGRFEAALASVDRAIALSAGDAWFHQNRGYVLEQLDEWDAALESYDRALEIDPNRGEAHFARSVLLLKTGDFERGWSEHEWRWKNERGTNILDRRVLRQPLWTGHESIAGRKVLLYAEQGFGDTIQFSRYVEHVAALGAQVTLEVQPPLASLMRTLAGWSMLVERGAELPDCDYRCPLMSLPLAFGTRLATIPAATAYLAAEPAKVERWRARLERSSRCRVGLAWSGSASFPNNHRRSAPLEQLLARLAADCQYINLQTDVSAADRQVLSQHPEVLDFTELQGDFSETAALCQCLDLVISVDTSIAHLSAALGKPTWIMLAHNADWRWFLGREDSPWYPTARLFRQRRGLEWGDVFGRIAAELTALQASLG